MAHRNIILHRLLGRVPWSQFNALVAKYKADKWVKALTAKMQFVALLFGQLKGRSGLRETVDVLNSRENQLCFAAMVSSLRVVDRESCPVPIFSDFPDLGKSILLY